MYRNVSWLSLVLAVAFSGSASAVSFSFTQTWTSNGVLGTGGYHGIELGDMDGDGDLDIATDHNNGGEHAVVLENTSGTTFSAILNTSRTDWGEPGFVDLGNDGDLDWVSSHANGTVGHGFENTTGSTFSTGVTNGITTNTASPSNRKDNLTIFDYNQDGFDDWIEHGNGGVQMFLNNTAGAFPTQNVSLQPGWVYDAEFGNYNNDPYLDLAAYVAGGPFVIYTQDALGNFTNAGISIAGAAGSGATLGGTKLEWGDYDGDGDDDLAVASNVGSILLYKNDGATFNFDAELTSSGGLGDPEWADLDGDGDPDLVAAGGGFDGVATWENVGGTLTLDFTTSGFTGARLAVGDFNNDGDIDFVSMQGLNGIYAWENTTPQVPEPSSLALAGLGLLGLAGWGWRRRSR